MNDVEAQRKFYQEALPILLAVLGKRSNEAEDLAQEILHRLMYSSKLSFENTGNTKGWLLKIAANARRRQLRRQPKATSASLENYASKEDQNHANQLESTEIKNKLQGAFRQALSKSPESSLEILRLLSEGHGPTEIAKKLNIKLDTTKKRIKAIRKECASYLYYHHRELYDCFASQMRKFGEKSR
ncbi:MAG: RNA polymerase sigma factor [Phycisphaerales bacterium]|nr:RNA polymerase sigma factor [Phycisphaerales bacterium]